MDSYFSEILPLLELLIPGFVATLFFYWFAEIKKPEQFERVIQALALTTLIKLLTEATKATAIYLGQFYSIASWGSLSSTATSLAYGALIGLLLAYLCNRDKLYAVGRLFKITAKSAQSDFISAFQKLSTGRVALHFVDGRRICGILRAYPASKDSGSYILYNPEWLINNKAVPIQNVAYILLDSSDIRWVEFLKRSG